MGDREWSAIFFFAIGMSEKKSQHFIWCEIFPSSKPNGVSISFSVWVDLLTFLLFDFYCYFFFNKLRLVGNFFFPSCFHQAKNPRASPRKKIWRRQEISLYILVFLFHFCARSLMWRWLLCVPHEKRTIEANFVSSSMSTTTTQKISHPWDT